MRSSLLRVATTIVVGLLVSACGSSPSPFLVTASAPTSPSTITTPAATASPAAVSPTNMVIAAGGTHTCALTSGGGVKCWGENYYGEVGNRTTESSFTPVDVSGLASGVMSIAAGQYHTCALMNVGGVKCWGYGELGPLGDGKSADSSVPVDVSGLASGVSAIAAGGFHTCAVTSGGGVKCWGSNEAGQVGNGSMTYSLVPVDVSGLASGVSALAAGGYRTCALMDAGGVKCWGYNGTGVLGDGTMTPVDVSGLRRGIIAIAASGGNTCALTRGGGVKCWGSNGSGQLGNGTTTDSSVPVNVSGLASGITAIAAGGAHTCALTNGGGVTCWGSNEFGQLGDGTTTASSHPVDVSGLASGVTAIAAGGAHTCALKDVGGVKCWGYNGTGTLGDGTTTDSSFPVNVNFATPSPSTAPPSEAPPDPPPASTPQASLTSGPLRIDGLALVVADRLNVRSAPGTGADSMILAEPLTKGSEVFVVAGPVPANRYLWWQVEVLAVPSATGPTLFFGWIAAAGGDGETWVAPAAVACPADPSIADLARLGRARSLVCYGGRNLQFRAFRQQLCGDGPHNLEAWSPAWITRPFGSDELLDREPIWPDQTGLKIYGRAHPSLVKSAAPYFDCSGEGTGWSDVTGHFDDPVSSDCRITFYDMTTNESVEEEPALSIAKCRQTFVYTELRPARGP